MPVTRTAKRALRSSDRKAEINKHIVSQLGIALRVAKRDKTKNSVIAAVKLTDRAAKRKVIHKNKAARIKSALTKLSKSTKSAAPAKKSKAKKS